MVTTTTTTTTKLSRSDARQRIRSQVDFGSGSARSYGERYILDDVACDGIIDALAGVVVVDDDPPLPKRIACIGVGNENGDPAGFWLVEAGTSTRYAHVERPDFGRALVDAYNASQQRAAQQRTVDEVWDQLAASSAAGLLGGYQATSAGSQAASGWHTGDPPTQGNYLVWLQHVPTHANRAVAFWHLPGRPWSTTTGGELHGTVVAWQPLPE